MPQSVTKSLGELLRTVPIKGRHSKEEKEAERRAEQILRTPEWAITRETAFEDVEHLVVVLTKCASPGLSLCSANPPSATCATSHTPGVPRHAQRAESLP